MGYIIETGQAFSRKDELRRIVDESAMYARSFLANVDGRYAQRKLNRQKCNRLVADAVRHTGGRTSAVLYPCAGSDISTALTFKPRNLVTIDRKNTLVQGSRPDNVYHDYLMNRLDLNMMHITKAIDARTLMIDLGLADVPLESIRLVESQQLQYGYTTMEFTQFEYQLATGEQCTHYNISGIDLEHEDTKKVLQETELLSSVAGGAEYLYLDKAGYRVEPYWLPDAVELQGVLTDSPIGSPFRRFRTLESEPEFNTLLSKQVSEELRVPFLYGYATSPDELRLYVSAR